ncbi:MAG: Ig-like domain-containing protein [Beijerinckiaceae bacterium]
MLYYDADPRDGGQGAGCSTCCCTAMSLRPGETNMIVLNYAGWSLPIAPPGIVPTMDFSIEANDSSCPVTPIDGYLPPTNTNYLLSTPVSTTLSIDLGLNAAPAGNTFSFEIMPLSGPSRGQLIQTGVPGSGTFDYVPNGGLMGFDYFSYQMTDAQGRSVIRTVRISIGNHLDRPDAARLSLLPFIDANRIRVNQLDQTVSFPIYMPLSCRSCDEFRLMIRQPARDCDRNEYNHLSCFDIRCKDCG